jgi:hypothetical protein
MQAAVGQVVVKPALVPLMTDHQKTKRRCPCRRLPGLLQQHPTAVEHQPRLLIVPVRPLLTSMVLVLMAMMMRTVMMMLVDFTYQTRRRSGEAHLAVCLTHSLQWRCPGWMAWLWEHTTSLE